MIRTLDEIVAAVSDVSGVTIEEMKSKSRIQRFVFARAAVARIAINRGGRKFTQAAVGRYFSHDRTTVIYWLQLNDDTILDIERLASEKIAGLSPDRMVGTLRRRIDTLEQIHGVPAEQFNEGRYALMELGMWEKQIHPLDWY